VPTGNPTPARSAANPIRASRSKPKGRGFAKPATTAGSRNGKFNAAGERVNGVWMASGAQAERYRQLLAMEEAGRILNLRTEVPFDLIVNNILICRYRADFTYDIADERGEPTVDKIEDVKGMVTPEFSLKLKLFNALMPTPLSVIHVKGKCKHPVAERNGTEGKGTGAGWMHRHWADRIPD
jgi:hypothetical protein